MDLFGIFELFDRRDKEKEGGAAPSHPGPYANVERKIDLLLRELGVDTGPLAGELGLPADVRDLLAQGRKIEAIKLYRERTDSGLKEAKDAVEGRGGLSSWLLLERKLDLVLNELGIEDTGGTVRVKDDPSPGYDRNRVDQLIRDGNLIEAIRVYREQTGCGLREAKSAVEERAATLRLKGR